MKVWWQAMIIVAYYVYKRYKKQKQLLIDSMVGINKKGRKNNYPVIMVHGTLGYVNDQHFFLRSYWSHAFQILDENEEVYEADVGGVSSVHDRAWELYQQIVGMAKIEEWATKNNRSIIEQIYGVEQVKEKHRGKYYKTRYLRSVHQNLSKTTAHLQGIENWNESNKIHLVGHSLGAQTIRYFQHLLKIGFFEDEYKSIDRSNWIASINCISAPFNGSHITHMFGYDEPNNKIRECFATKLLKYKVITANLLSRTGTQNQANEVIISRTKEAHDLALIYWNVMYDINVEHFGWNRELSESATDYIFRIWSDDYLQTISNNAFWDMGFNIE